MRTTIDLDPSILRALKQRQQREHKTLGQLVSELLSVSLAEPPKPPADLQWIVQDLQPRVDLEDTDAVYAILDAE